MATNRILEFTPSQEEAIVARILVLLHQAVDDHFPSAEKATRQFTKTVFSDDSERTALGAPPEGAVAHGFGNEEKTGPGEKPPEVPLPPLPTAAQSASAGASSRPATKPPPPQVSVPLPPTPAPPPAVTQPMSRRAATAPMATANAGGMSAASALSGMPTGMSGIGKKGNGEGRDWVTMATLALLVAGLILLAYSFLV